MNTAALYRNRLAQQAGVCCSGFGPWAVCKGEMHKIEVLH